MAALTFFAYFFLGIGPGLAFFIAFIAPKSFLTLLTFFSAFIWLVVLLVTAAIFKGFLPIEPSISSYAGVLVASVFIQEACRYGVWFLHKKSMVLLEATAREQGQRFVLLDKLYVALAWGYGHSVCHTVFFVLSFLGLTSGSGTYYIAACPQMSMFLIGALYSLAFGMILSSIMVISFEGLDSGNWIHVAAAPAVHLAASLVTLASMNKDGCMIAVPVDLAIGVASMVYAGQMAWRKGMSDLTATSRQTLLPPAQRQSNPDEGGELQPLEHQESGSMGGPGRVRTRRGAPVMESRAGAPTISG